MKKMKTEKKKSEHYYTEKPSSPMKINEIIVRARGKELRLSSASGLFSLKRLDKGTELLINSAMIKDSWKLLDLGCGYGVVGITIKKAMPSVDVVFSDVNERALQVTSDNLKSMKLKAKVLKSDSFGSITDNDFDTILLNPPQTAGKKVCFGMIEDSINHLKKGGLLQIVARHNKGGKELSRKMEEVFGNVKDIAKKGSYRVYVSEKTS